MPYTILPNQTKHNRCFVTLYRERGVVFFSSALYKSMGKPNYVVAGKKDSGELAFKAAEEKDEFCLQIMKSGTSRYVRIYCVEFLNEKVIPRRCPTKPDGLWWYLVGIKIK